jgi:hypothetical protein
LTSRSSAPDNDGVGLGERRAVNDRFDAMLGKDTPDQVAISHANFLTACASELSTLASIRTV